jgi:hypothetical protein
MSRGASEDGGIERDAMMTMMDYSAMSLNDIQDLAPSVNLKVDIEPSHVCMA